MDRGAGAAARLPESDRRALAIQVLAGGNLVTDLADRHGVSRKFVYTQTQKARVVLDEAFLTRTVDDEVLFDLTVTRTWLHQVIVALPLICHSSYRGVVEFIRDLFGVSVSVGTVHDVLQSATRRATIINNGEDLSGIRVGLHDEIFQGATPMLAGIDAASTYCYLLEAAEHRDADTWGVRLIDAASRGLKPDHTIADARQGLRARQRAAWGDAIRATAMCSTSSGNMKVSPTRWRVWPGAPGRGTRSWKPGSAAPGRLDRILTSSSRWRSRGAPKPRRPVWRVTSAHSPNG
jgi:hypothetical protein